MRFALHYAADARTVRDKIAHYLPSNYAATTVMAPHGPAVLIFGEDHAGWTMDGYCLPRLASGWYSAQEISEAEADAMPALG